MKLLYIGHDHIGFSNIHGHDCIGFNKYANYIVTM